MAETTTLSITPPISPTNRRDYSELTKTQVTGCGAKQQAKSLTDESAPIPDGQRSESASTGSATDRHPKPCRDPGAGSNPTTNTTRSRWRRYRAAFEPRLHSTLADPTSVRLP